MADAIHFKDIFLKAREEAFHRSSRVLLVSSPSPETYLSILKDLQPEGLFTSNLETEGKLWPWPPLVELCHYFWKGKTIPEGTVQTLNTPLFQDLLLDNPHEWTPPLLESIPYEIAGLCRDFTSLIRDGREGPMVIGLANSQNLSKESLDIIFSLLDSSTQRQPLLLVLHFDEKKVQKMGEKGDFILGYYWEKVFLGEVIKLEGEPDLPQPPVRDPKILLKVLVQCRNFLSLSQGTSWGETIQEAHIYRQLSEKEKFRFHSDLGCLYLLSDELDQALLQLQEPNSAEQDPQDQHIRDYLLVWTLMKRGQWQDAVALAESKRLQCEENNETRWEALFRYGVHDVSRRFNREHFADQDKYQKLIDALERENLTVFKISALVNHPFEYRSSSEIKNHSAPIEEGLALAQKAGHDFSLSTAFHRMGTHIAAQVGESAALPFYFKAAEVRRRLGQALPLVRIHNGIAHSFLNQGDFSSAMDYLSENFKLLDKVPDYAEIVVTLFNLGQVYFFGRDFPMAREALQKVLRFLPLLGLTHIPFNSHADILILLAYCKLMVGENLSGQGILETIRSQKDSLNPHSVFLLYLAEMAQKVLEKAPWQDIDHSFQQALENIPINKTFQTRSLAFLYHESNMWLKKADMNWKAKELWIKAQNLRTSRDLLLFNRWFDHPWEVHREWKFPFTHLETPLGVLESLVKQERNLISLHKRLREIQFLSASMEIFQSVERREDFGPMLTAHVMDFFPSSAVELWEYDGGKWQILGHSGAGVNLDHRSLEWLAVQEALRTKAQAVPLNLAVWDDFLAFPIKDGTNLTGLMILLSKPGQVYSSHSTNVLGILAHHIGFQLQRINRQQELERFSRTDGLTGLLNRKALDEEVLKEERRMNHLVLSGTTPEYTVAFLDLDNFKYYNDSFGHQAGDFLLIWFAQLMKESFFASDLLFRYGGDEFIVLMRETPLEGGTLAAKKLLQNFADKHFFLDALAEVLGETPAIPQSKKLSCSMGLASWSRGMTLDQLLGKADKALYKAKANGKNTFAISEDMT